MKQSKHYSFLNSKNKFERKINRSAMYIIIFLLFCICLLWAASEGKARSINLPRIGKQSSENKKDEMIELSTSTIGNLLKISPYVERKPLIDFDLIKGQTSFNDNFIEEAPFTPDQARMLRDGKKFFGVTAHLIDDDKSIVDAKIASLVDLGINIVRIEFRWSEIEKKKGVWDLQAYDYAIERCKQNNIQVVGNLVFSPDWASTAPPGTIDDEIIAFPPSDFNYYKNSIAFLAKRYKTTIDYWQLWTEADNKEFWRPEPDPIAYSEFARGGYLGVKEGNPSAKVLMSGITTGFKAKFFEESLSHGLSDSYEIIASHNYSNSPEGNIFQEAADLKSLSFKYKKSNVPLWLTEIGWSTYDDSDIAKDLKFIDPVSEELQAINIARRMLYLVDIPVSDTFVYGLNDFDDHKDILLFNLGLMRHDLSKKPSYSIFKNVNNLIGGQTDKVDFIFNTKSTRPESFEFHSFINGNNDLVLAIWDNSGKNATVDVDFTTDDFEKPEEFNLSDGSLTNVTYGLQDNHYYLQNIKIGKSPKIFIMRRPSFYSSSSNFSPNGDGIKDAINFFFALDTTDNVTVQVSNSDGSLVKTLWSQQTTPGTHKLTWNGRSETDSYLPDDNYFIKVIGSSGFLGSSKIIIDTHYPIAKSLSTLPEELFIEPEEHEKPYIVMPTWFETEEPVTARLEVFDRNGSMIGWIDHDKEFLTGKNMVPWYVNFFNYSDDTYWYKLILIDSAGNRSIYLPRADWQSFRIDFESPEIINFDFSNEVISPNGDGKNDNSDITFNVSENADIIISAEKDGHQYYIYAKKNVTAGEHIVSWNGKAADSKTNKLVELPEGDYLCKIVAIDKVGLMTESFKGIKLESINHRSVNISASFSKTSFTPNGDGKDDTALLHFGISKTASVFISYTDLNGQVQYVYAKEELPSGNYEFTWYGLEESNGELLGLEDGRYRFKVEAIDLSAAIAEADLNIDLKRGNFTPPNIRDVIYRPIYKQGNIRGVFSFSLSEDSDVKIELTDLMGNKFSTIEKKMDVGRNYFNWDGNAFRRSANLYRRILPGVYSFTIIARDVSGKESKRSGINYLTVR